MVFCQSSTRLELVSEKADSGPPLYRLVPFVNCSCAPAVSRLRQRAAGVASTYRVPRLFSNVVVPAGVVFVVRMSPGLVKLCCNPRNVPPTRSDPPSR